MHEFNRLKLDHIGESSGMQFYGLFPKNINIDDIEFYIDEENKIIHFKSASRVGYSDLGANRKRMDEIIKLFHK